MGYYGEAGFAARFRKSMRNANSKLPAWSLLLIGGFLLGEFFLTPFMLAVMYATDVIVNLFTKKKLKTVYLIMIFALGIAMKDHLGALFFILFLYIIDFMFNIMMRFVLRPIYRMAPLGLELVLFNTVLVGYGFGPVAGIITGLLFGTTYYGVIFSFNSTYQFINIPAYALIGYLAGTLQFGSLFGLGMTLAVIYAFLTSFLIFIFFGGKLSKSIIFIVSNILFNYWLFSHMSPIVLNIIS